MDEQHDAGCERRKAHLVILLHVRWPTRLSVSHPCFRFVTQLSLAVHGCILKLDRPGEYKASLVDARFPKKSDAKAAVCLQAMSEGIGDYIRSIASALDNKVTPTMRSFSSSLVFPALTSGLSKIDTALHPHFEYDKERDGWHSALSQSVNVI